MFKNNNEVERELNLLKKQLRNQSQSNKFIQMRTNTKNQYYSSRKYTLVFLVFLILLSSFAGAGYYLFQLYQSNTKFLNEHAKKSKQLNLETQAASEHFDKSLNKVSGWSPLGKGYEKMIAAERAEKEADTESGYSSSYSGSSYSSSGRYVRSYTRRDGTRVKGYYRGGGGRRR